MTTARPTTITPHLWFEQGCVDAARFYTDAFPEGRITHTGALKAPAVGVDCAIVEFEVAGQRIVAIDAGPQYRPNPAVSFLLNFDPDAGYDAEDLDALWEKLADGGEVRMELGEYPFSKRYGWVVDRFGIEWQLMLTRPEGAPRPFLIPVLMFSDDQYGRAEEAVRHYARTFRGRVGQVLKYPAGAEPNKEGTIMFSDVRLCGTWFAAMDNPTPQGLSFHQAVSWLVECDDQAEMDRLSDALSADPDAERCGWLTDKFGMPWQITPRRLHEMLRTGTAAQAAHVTQILHPMKRLDLAALEAAYDQTAPTAHPAPTSSTDPPKE